jgi:hypothetical protein
MGDTLSNIRICQVFWERDLENIIDRMKGKERSCIVRGLEMHFEEAVWSLIDHEK